MVSHKTEKVNNFLAYKRKGLKKGKMTLYGENIGN